MPNLTLQTRPRLLMLSHCLPRQMVMGKAHRAWQLLTLAHRTHDVYLAALADGPVNLADWRTAKAVAAQIVLIPARAGLFSWLRSRRLSSIARIAGEWSQQHAFDMVLSTEASLLGHAEQIEGAWRVLDAASLEETTPIRRTILPRMRRRRKATQQANLEQVCIRQSDAWITTRSHRPATFQGRLHPRLILDHHDDVMQVDSLAQFQTGGLHMPATTTPAVARAA